MTEQQRMRAVVRLPGEKRASGKYAWTWVKKEGFKYKEFADWVIGVSWFVFPVGSVLTIYELFPLGKRMGYNSTYYAVKVGENKWIQSSRGTIGKGSKKWKEVWLAIDTQRQLTVR